MYILLSWNIKVRLIHYNCGSAIKTPYSLARVTRVVHSNTAATLHIVWTRQLATREGSIFLGVWTSAARGNETQTRRDSHARRLVAAELGMQCVVNAYSIWYVIILYTRRVLVHVCPLVYCKETWRMRPEVRLSHTVTTAQSNNSGDWSRSTR